MHEDYPVDSGISEAPNNMANQRSLVLWNPHGIGLFSPSIALSSFFRQTSVQSLDTGQGSISAVLFANTVAPSSMTVDLAIILIPFFDRQMMACVKQ